MLFKDCLFNRTCSHRNKEQKIHFIQVLWQINILLLCIFNTPTSMFHKNIVKDQ